MWINRKITANLHATSHTPDLAAINMKITTTVLFISSMLSSIISLAQNDSTNTYKTISNLPSNSNWNIIILEDTIEGIVIKHEEQMLVCGHFNAASLTIIKFGTDTIRIIDICNMENYKEGVSVIVSPDNEPHYGVNIPSYVKGGFRQRKRAHTYTNEFDQIVETTAFGKMTKK